MRGATLVDIPTPPPHGGLALGLGSQPSLQMPDAPPLFAQGPSPGAGSSAGPSHPALKRTRSGSRLVPVDGAPASLGGGYVSHGLEVDVLKATGGGGQGQGQGLPPLQRVRRHTPPHAATRRHTPPHTLLCTWRRDGDARAPTYLHTHTQTHIHTHTHTPLPTPHAPRPWVRHSPLPLPVHPLRRTRLSSRTWRTRSSSRPQAATCLRRGPRRRTTASPLRRCNHSRRPSRRSRRPPHPCGASQAVRAAPSRARPPTLSARS